MQNYYFFLIYASIWVFFIFFVGLSVRQRRAVFVYMFVYLFICMFVYLFVCLYVCLFIMLDYIQFVLSVLRVFRDLKDLKNLIAPPHYSVLTTLYSILSVNLFRN